MRDAPSRKPALPPRGTWPVSPRSTARTQPCTAAAAPRSSPPVAATLPSIRRRRVSSGPPDGPGPTSPSASTAANGSRAGSTSGPPGAQTGAVPYVAPCVRVTTADAGSWSSWAGVGAAIRSPTPAPTPTPTWDDGGMSGNSVRSTSRRHCDYYPPYRIHTHPPGPTSPPVGPAARPPPDAPAPPGRCTRPSAGFSPALQARSAAHGPEGTYPGHSPMAVPSNTWSRAHPGRGWAQRPGGGKTIGSLSYLYPPTPSWRACSGPCWSCRARTR